MWQELYGKFSPPSNENINTYVNSELWDKLCDYLENTYQILPNIQYSSCSMQKGWNVKYKKGGKSLTTLYPMENYFIALVVIGEKERAEADFLIQTCSDYTKKLYKDTKYSSMGSWLMIEVKDDLIYDDVIKLIELRVPPKNKVNK